MPEEHVPDAYESAVMARLGGFRRGAQDDGTDEAKEMRRNRAVNRRTASGTPSGSGGGGNISFATGRPRDPMFYWRENNLPWDLSKDDELHRVKDFCRLLAITHPIVGPVIDILACFPLTGLELKCKDPALVQFYTDLFFSQLDYEEFLVEIGREYFAVGEVFPLGSFNETLGVWEADELIEPKDVEVIRSPFLKEPRFEMRLPESIKRVIQERQPRWEFEALMRSYPELKNFLGPDARMPVSNVLMKHIKMKGNYFHPRGLPIWLRGFRAIIQEEKLNAALDAIADRLYTPLILAKLGASATDLGTNVPWIPTDNDLLNFEESLDAALAADFRVLTHHFGLEMASVFGRESMPDLNPDFERITDRILQCVGMSRTMLNGSCLVGDTMIHTNRGHKGIEMTIEHLYKRYSDHTKTPGHPWDYSIPTYVCREVDGVVRLGLLQEVWASGVKEVFEVTTDGGKKIQASAEHPFMTQDRGWVLLKDLDVGDSVRVNTGRKVHLGGPSRSGPYRSIETRFHPNQAKRGAPKDRLNPRFSVLQHRLVMEAALNEVPYEEFVRALRRDPMRSKEFYYLPPGVDVHHIDRDGLNNDPSNLEVLIRSTHTRQHLEEEPERKKDVLWQIGSETIISIVSQGEKPTFDLSVADDPHNFLANDFVVHNSTGETYAGDALNRDLLSQILKVWQRRVTKFVKDRMLVVAEAQEHYDYEERNGKRYPIMEEILEIDEETGEQRIVEQPKLLVPDLILPACLALGTRVQTARGSVDVESILAGDQVIAWDSKTGKMEERSVTASVSNGVKDIYRIKTGLGREIGVTDEHPFWVEDQGWTKAAHLEVGMQVRIASSWQPDMVRPISEDVAYFAGVMVGDGCMTSTGVQLTSVDDEVVEWVNKFVRPLGCHITKNGKSEKDYRICQVDQRVRPNPVKEILRELGLWGHNAFGKRVPANVWSGGPFAWAAFLSGFLDTDGSVVPDRSVKWYSSNSGLLRDCQMMLAYLGVRGSLNKTQAVPCEMVPVPRHEWKWCLGVYDKRSLMAADRALTARVERKSVLWTKPTAIDSRRVLTPDLAMAVQKDREAGLQYKELAEKYGVSKSCCFRAVKGQYDRDFDSWVSPDWDEIDEIRVDPAGPTWLLEVEGLHTHVTEGLITHNCNLRDQETERQFYEALRATGVPISMKTRLTNVPVTLEDEYETTRQEQVDQAVEAQRARKETYLALRAEGLPIPEDLKADFEPKALNAPSGNTQGMPSQQPPPLPTIGLGDPASTAGLAPTEEDLAMTGTDPTAGQMAGMDPSMNGGGGATVIPLPTNSIMDRQRPPESDEMRADMPKAKRGNLSRLASRQDIDGMDIPDPDAPIDPEVGGTLIDGPKHIGARRFANLDPDVPLDEQL